MIGRAYRTAQILSLDIVIGAVILLRFFCAQLEVSVDWPVYALLGATVWLIYTADHLRDSETAEFGHRERYQFHLKHRKRLVLAMLVVVLFAAPLVFFIPAIIFFGGLVLGLFSLIYLFIQHKLSSILSKELYVAVVYTMGIMMVPMLMKMTFKWEILIMLFLLTFVNLIIYSWYEREDDFRDEFHSIATQLTSNQLEKIIVIILSLGLAISVLTFNITHIYFITGFLIYSLMILFTSWFRNDHRYRAIGDGVFLLPIFFEWL